MILFDGVNSGKGDDSTDLLPNDIAITSPMQDTT